MSFKGKEGGVPEYDVQTGYNLYASSYDKVDSAFLDSFDKKLFMRLLRDLKGKKVIDIGAGTGRMGALIRSRAPDELVATDISEEMLQIAEKKNTYSKTFLWDVLESAPVEYEDYFDIAIATLMLVHIPHRDLATALEHMAYVMKKEGLLYVLNIPQRRAPLLTAETGERFYISSSHHSDATVVEELQYAGFEIVDLQYGTEHKDVISTLFVAKKR